MGLGIGATVGTAAAWLTGREVGNYVAMKAPTWAAAQAYNATTAIGEHYLGTLGGYFAAPFAGIAGLEAGGYVATAGLGGPLGLAAGLAVQTAASYALPILANKAYEGAKAGYEWYNGAPTADENAAPAA